MRCEGVMWLGLTDLSVEIISSCTSGLFSTAVAVTLYHCAGVKRLHQQTCRGRQVVSSVKASFNNSIAEERRTLNVEENNLRNRRERESQICVKQKCLWGNGISINVLKRAEIIQSNTRRWLWREARSNPKIRSPCHIIVRLFVLKTAACIPSLSLNIIPTNNNKENDPADVNAFHLSPQWLPNSLHLPHRVCS